MKSNGHILILAFLHTWVNHFFADCSSNAHSNAVQSLRMAVDINSDSTYMHHKKLYSLKVNWLKLAKMFLVHYWDIFLTVMVYGYILLFWHKIINIY